MTTAVQAALDFYDVNISDEVIILGNYSSVSQTVPQLTKEQRENVVKAERRFFVGDIPAGAGKGFLITDGTGTGKTFSGLGIAKRFMLQGKENILIVVPTDGKCKDWISEAKLLDINIYQLESIHDSFVTS